MAIFFIGIAALYLGNNMMGCINSYLCMIVELAGLARLYTDTGISIGSAAMGMVAYKFSLLCISGSSISYPIKNRMSSRMVAVCIIRRSLLRFSKYPMSMSLKKQQGLYFPVLGYHNILKWLYTASLNQPVILTAGRNYLRLPYRSVENGEIIFKCNLFFFASTIHNKNHSLFCSFSVCGYLSCATGTGVIS